jgi:hypothetical protein
VGDRSVSKELRCSFCGEAQEPCQKLISSPKNYDPVGWFHRRHFHREFPGAYICDQCVARCTAALAGLPEPAGNRLVNAPGCSFCSKGPGVVKLVPALGESPSALICEECLEVCRSILEDDLKPEGDDQAAES